MYLVDAQTQLEGPLPRARLLSRLDPSYRVFYLSICRDGWQKVTPDMPATAYSHCMAAINETRQVLETIQWHSHKKALPRILKAQCPKHYLKTFDHL